MTESLLALLFLVLLVGVCYGIGRFLVPPIPPIPPAPFPPADGEKGGVPGTVGATVSPTSETLLSPTPPFSPSAGGKGAGGIGGNSLERFVFAVPLGMGVLSLVLLALGICRLFVTPVFYGILALGIPGLFFLWRDVFAPTTVVNSGQRSVDRKSGAAGSLGNNPALSTNHSPQNTNSSNLLDLGFKAIFGVLAVCTLIAALAPPGGSEWDALSYHLTVPKAYLREARIFYVPYDHHSNFPFLLQMLYTLMLGVKSIGGAKLCHWLCGVLLTLSVYTFAQRQHPDANGKRIGQIAALLVAASPIVLWEASIAYVDLATALFTWLSVYAFLGSREWGVGSSSENTGTPSGSMLSPTLLPIPYSLSALLMGFAIGTKWTVLGFWGITLAGIVVADVLQNRRVTADLVKRVLIWASISLLLALPWLLRSYLYTGSPVYPYFYNIFGGRFWSVENATQYSNDQANLGLGKDPIFLLLAPWLMNILPTASKFNEYPFGLSFAVVPLLLAAPLKPGKWTRTSIALALFAVLGYVFWFFLVQGTRYFIPILPVVALLAAETFMGLWNVGKGFARYVGAVLLAASGVWGMYFASNVFAVPAIRVALGAQSRSEYVASTQWMGTLLPACEWINANTPPDSKVALFDVVFGFYIDRPILWANPNHSGTLLPWDDYRTADDWLADFKRRGYTTLLVDEAFAPPTDSPLQEQKWRMFLQEAVASDKVEVAFEKANEFEEGNPRRRVCRVYRIR